MQAILPRQRTCVLCGDPIEGKGRIDRLYCSASCRNLAWRFRAGKRSGKAPTTAPADASRRRDGLLRQAWGARGELAAARRHIAALDDDRTQAQLRAAADQQHMTELRAELDRERAERSRLVAELTAAQQRAAAQDAEVSRLQAALDVAQAAARAQSAAHQEEVQRLQRRYRALDERLLTAERGQAQSEASLAEALQGQETLTARLADLERQAREAKQPPPERTPEAGARGPLKPPPKDPAPKRETADAAAGTPVNTAQTPKSETPGQSGTAPPPPESPPESPSGETDAESWWARLRKRIAAHDDHYLLD